MPPKKTNPKQVAIEATDLGEASDENDGAKASMSASSPASSAHEESTQGNKQVLSAIASLDAKITQMKADICDTLRGEIAVLRAENDEAISALRTEMENHNVQLKDLSESATSMSNSVLKLEEKVKQLSSKVEQLTEKCIDLEGRSKRHNIRITGLLRDLLDLDETPLLDRAHRALRALPGDDAPPRHLINLKFGDIRVQIFCDLPQAVVKRRAAFTPVRNLLRDQPGVKHGLLYPDKLRVTHNDTELVFTDPKEACRYAQEKFGS
ncbi:dedicator of cytokinesis protein 1 [Sarotherodon galilaeus]